MRRSIWASAFCTAVGLYGGFLPSTCFRSSVTIGEPAQESSAVLFSEGFDDSRLLERGWYDGDHFTISDLKPSAGKGCIEYRWKARSTNPSSSSGIRRLFDATETVYVRFYIRLSEGWGWSGRGYHPHLMHFMTTENRKYDGPAATHLTVYIEPQNGKLRLAAQDIQNRDAPHGLTQGELKGGYNAQVFDSKDSLFADHDWHCVEAMFQLNSLDLKADKPNADGIVRAWFDGKLVIERTDIVLRSTDFPNMKFNQFLLTPYFGPGLLPHEQSLWIDELTVARTRIGGRVALKSDERSWVPLARPCLRATMVRLGALPCLSAKRLVAGAEGVFEPAPGGWLWRSSHDSTDLFIMARFRGLGRPRPQPPVRGIGADRDAGGGGRGLSRSCFRSLS